MAEELQESEVVFSDYDDRNEEISNNNGFFTEQHCGGRVVRNKNKNKKQKKVTSASSLPININIPDNIYQTFVDRDDQYEEENEGGRETTFTPPHVIVGRRIPGKMAFSVCTLKGRDLRRVRNSILRMTGFLEA